jgi:hypothetical protein
MFVTYIGRRPFWKDTVYHSGLTFESGQERGVPASLGWKLLKHRDLFVASETTEPIQAMDKPAPIKLEEDTALLIEAAEQRKSEVRKADLALLDQIQVMDKPALLTLADGNYKVALDKRKSLENLRLEVSALVTQFGAQ